MVKKNRVSTAELVRRATSALRERTKLGRPSGRYLSQDTVRNVLDTFANEIRLALLNGDEVAILNLGTVTTKVLAPRQGKNPRTGEQLALPARSRLHMHFGRALKSEVKKRLVTPA